MNKTNGVESYIANMQFEFKWLLSYIEESCFDMDISRDYLRMLWTVYCLHYNIDVDTAGYDNGILELWNRIAETEDDTADWSSFEDFDNFMCTYLV